MADVHIFDVRIAKLYGVNCAVILQNIWHWVQKNEANGTNFYDGTFWTYNSTKAFAAQFPYLSQRQIETALKKLRDENIIQTGNYNVMKYDRTLWYAITEKGKCILHTGEMEYASKGNGFTPEVEPIPDVTSYVNADVNADMNTVSKDTVCSTDVQLVIDAWNSLSLTRIIKIAKNTTRSKMLQKRIKDYGIDGILSAIENVRNSDFLNGKNTKGWQATFDWFIKPDNFEKVLSGNYANKQQQGQPIQRPVYQKQSKAQEMNEFYDMAASWAAESE